MLKLFSGPFRSRIASRLYSTPSGQVALLGRETPFTAEEDAIIRERRLEGDVFASIAQALGRPRSTVHWRWKKKIVPQMDHVPANLENVLASAEQRTLIESLLAAGRGTDYIAQRLGVPYWRTLRYVGQVRRGQLVPKTGRRTKVRWSAEEDSRLMELDYKAQSTSEIASRLGRTEKAVGSRLYVLKHGRMYGQRLGPRYPRWLPEEEELLKSLLKSKVSWAEACLHFPGRTVSSLRDRAWRLGLYTKRLVSWAPWTEAEDSLLHETRQAGLNWVQVARRLPGRSRRACAKRYCKRFEHPGTANGARWTPAEVDQMLRLVKQYGHDWKLISQHMDRRRDSIYNMHRRIQLGQANLELLQGTSRPRSTE